MWRKEDMQNFKLQNPTFREASNFKLQFDGWAEASSRATQLALTPTLSPGRGNSNGACSFSFSHQRDHHTLDLQFFPGNEIRVARVFGAQIGFAALHEIRFESHLPVDQRRHHVPGARFHAVLDNGDVAIENA